MKNLLIKGANIFLVVMVLLKLAYVFDLSKKGLTQNFSIELAECESEESEKISVEGLDDFFQETPFHGLQSNLCYQVVHHTNITVNTKTHIREIVSPPPQG